MNNNILVFASRYVGYEILRYLLDIKACIGQVIVSDDKDNNILDLALSFGIPARLYNQSTQDELIRDGQRYNWLLNLWSPRVLIKGVLELADHRLNTHPSLVPICQGNDNAAWAIRKNLPAGVSLIEMAEGIDQGDVYVQREVPYVFPIRGIELHSMLESESVTLFKDSWGAIYSNEIPASPQSGLVSYHTRSQTNRDRVLDGASVMTIEEVISWIYAHDFYPGTTAEIVYQGTTYKLTVHTEKK